jgi:hypothetical protein
MPMRRATRIVLRTTTHMVIDGIFPNGCNTEPRKPGVAEPDAIEEFKRFVGEPQPPRVVRFRCARSSLAVHFDHRRGFELPTRAHSIRRRRERLSRPQNVS